MPYVQVPPSRNNHILPKRRTSARQWQDGDEGATVADGTGGGQLTGARNW